MWWEYERFPRRQPKKVAGGIKAQSKRGSFGESWWAKRWIAVIEGFHIGGRLQRGRSYARGGQVLSIDVAAGKVSAKVQGSMPQPYKVTIEVAKLTDPDWAKVVSALSGQAVYAAKLLAGEMPSEIEKVATDAGVSLFPAQANDLKTSCSCPDWSNPCKHVAAVYYLLGEQFDRDPFLLFRLRGLEREALFARLSAAAPATPTLAVPDERIEVVAAAPTDPHTFWYGGEVPADLFTEGTSPPVAAALPKRLGPVPFWRGTERFLDAMEPIYRAASQTGVNVALGGPLPETSLPPAGVRAAEPRKRKK
ncbi:MAG: family helicase [Gemmataceae bacterium]|nr:family helicase [Gemmataceae bacterium]